MLKAYVYDQGWSGAEIYFSESRETALKYFQDFYLPRYKQADETHDNTWPPERHNPWKSHVKFWESTEFHRYIQEYELGEGQVISTEGE